MPQELDLVGLRFVRQVTQVSLAKRLKVTQPTLSHWEHGRRSIPLEYAIQIADALTEATPDDPVTERDIYAAWQISQKRYTKGQTPDPHKPRKAA